MTPDTPAPMILTGPSEDARTLKWLQLAATRPEDRATLSGVFVDGAVTVATDGFRLHVSPTPETLADHQGEIIAPTGGKWPSAGNKSTPYVATAEVVDANYPNYRRVVEDAQKQPVAAVVYLDAAFLTDFCNGLKKGTVVKIILPPNNDDPSKIGDPVILATVPHRDAPAPDRWAIVMPKNMHPDTDPGYDPFPFPRTEESEDSAS